MMNGRFFAGTQVEAYIASGDEKFKKSNEKKLGIEDDENGNGEAAAAEEEGKRLDEFGSWLEGVAVAKAENEAYRLELLSKKDF